MIYIGNNPDFTFKTNKKYTKETYECALNDKFNIILYSNYTTIIDDKVEETAFVIPVHYPSFIRTFDMKIDFTDIESFFVLQNKECKEALKEFVMNLKNKNFTKILDLKLK
ncbi:hypothetical protein TUBRATIS_14750 [Tubulinosema ratisbonensis]|uniref:Uncharacterized protein n=1 Tax=Tubulinosema ratisbonensis TaxID=291195 RepID=A0A437ALH5_9MICR|nr:hypothetical protein TUBRATIS_14750 [Tubulinosema ratisbonensis]